MSKNSKSSMFCSIYIPRISTFYTQTDVALKFEDMGIGYVNRVDFVALDKNTGFQKAFVHFDRIFQTQIASDILNILGYNENYDEEYNDRDKGCYNLYVDIDQTEYWILLRNNNPVQETNLNIHQVVENAKILEEHVMAQDEIIAQLNKDIEFLKNGFVLLSEQLLTIDEKSTSSLKHILGIEKKSNEYICNGCYGV